MHIGIGTVHFAVAVQNHFAQHIGIGRYFNVVAFIAECFERVEQRLKHRQVSGCAYIATVGWEVENDQGQLALASLFQAALHQLFDAPRQHVGALSAGEHVLRLVFGGEVAIALAACAARASRTRSATIDHGNGGAIQLRNGHHDGALDGQQAAL